MTRYLSTHVWVDPSQRVCEYSAVPAEETSLAFTGWG
jgi:hypothetical protein